MSTLIAGTYTGAATKVASAILAGYSTPTATGVDIRSTLFSNGEKGVWFDPYDFSTMFQDSAGTTPVTAVGQPVGKILDKSGNGFHATQATSTARPTLGRHPITGVRNLLTGTDALATQSYTTAAAAYTLSFTGTGTVTLSGAYVGSLVGTGASNRVSLTFTSTAASLTLTVSGSVTFAQLEKGSAVTNYQSVVSQFDITEAGVNYAYYLYGDGVDNAMATASFSIPSQQTTVVAGIYKANDVASVVVEFGNNAASNGHWFVVSGNDVAASGFEFMSNGSALGVAGNTGVFNNVPAPRTAVITGIGDIANSVARVRYNGTVGTDGTASQGTGTYGNFTLNILARSGGTVPLLGNLYGLIVRGAASSASEVAVAEQWMNSKTGAY